MENWAYAAPWLSAAPITRPVVTRLGALTLLVAGAFLDQLGGEHARLLWRWLAVGLLLALVVGITHRSDLARYGRQRPAAAKQMSACPGP